MSDRETRERLLNIMREARNRSLTSHNVMDHDLGMFADALLKNGVIVPPCKVGDTVYCLINRDNELDCCSKHICMSEVENFSFEKRGNEQLLLVHLDFWNTDINPRTAVEFVDVVFGKTVFLTREEAEKALKERENNV